MKKILFLLLILLSLNSCEFFHLFDYFDREQNFIEIANNSEDSICFYPYSLRPNISGWATYPDTLLPPDDLKTLMYKSIPPHSYMSLEVEATKNELKEIFGFDSLMIFIFSKDTLNAYSWEEIRSGYKILKRFDFNINDLDSLNWTLTYP